MCDPTIYFVSPPFHIANDDDFQTVKKSDASTLPSNWKDIFIKDYVADDVNFETPIQTKMNNNDVCIKVKFAEYVSNNENTIETVLSISEGDNHNPEISISNGEKQTNISENERQDAQGSKSDSSLAQTITRSEGPVWHQNV